MPSRHQGVKTEAVTQVRSLLVIPPELMKRKLLVLLDTQATACRRAQAAQS